MQPVAASVKKMPMCADGERSHIKSEITEVSDGGPNWGCVWMFTIGCITVVALVWLMSPGR